MADGFKIADAYVEIHADKSQLQRDINAMPRDTSVDTDRAGRAIGGKLGTSAGDELGKKLGPASTKAGNDSGGKLAQGFRMSFLRNSPLIVAAVSGALLAGGPVLLAGATALFAGIGAIAAAQQNSVRSAWLGMFHDVRDGAVADAAVLGPTYIRMADQIGASFERMRPLIRDAFAAAAPQVEVFTSGITRLAENALPGMVRAVERGMPVTVGLANMLSSIGTGWSQMFDNMSGHSEAAGTALDAIGRILGALLPILGTFMGQGAELASMILPPLASVLEVLADVLEDIGPVLPAIVLGLTGMKIANAVTGGIGSLAAGLGKLATSGGAFSGVAGKLAGGMSGLAGAAGPAAAGVAFFTVALTTWLDMAEKTAELNRLLGRSFEVGGSQAEAAGRALDQFSNSLFGKVANGLPDVIKNYSILGHSIGDMIPSVENAKKEYDDWYDSLSKTGQLQEDVAVKQDALTQAVEDFGAGTPAASKASREFLEAQRELAAAQQEVEMATRGVTEAMLGQADAAMARADSDLAHRQAIDQADDSYKALTDAIRDYGAGSEEASDAAMAFEGDLGRVVATARTLAEDALPANMDANSKIALSNIAARDSLRELAAQYGENMPPALQAMLAELERVTAGYDITALEAEKLRAETEDAATGMDKLGSKEANPKIKGDASIFAGVEASTNEAMNKLEAKIANPKIHGESSVFAGVAAATDQKLKQLDASVATPKAKLDSSMFAGVHAAAMGSIAQLAAQRPTPVAGLNDSGLKAANKAAMQLMASLNAQRANPVATLIDNASGVANSIRNAINAIQSKTVTVTVREVKAKAGGGQVTTATFAATGRKVSGPGGPTDDLVQATGPNGSRYQLSNGEQIVNAAVSRFQGDERFRLLNAGLADIVPRMQAAMSSAGSPAPGVAPKAAAAMSRAASIRDLHVHVAGMFDLRNPAEVRRLAVALRAALDDLIREES